MKRSKGIQLGAMLAAMLLVMSFMVVPAAMAKTNEGTSNLSDPATVKALVDKLSKEGNNAPKAFHAFPPLAQNLFLVFLSG